MKFCPKCKTEKKAAEFALDRGTKDGLNAKCRVCVSEYKKQYRKENAAKIKEWFDKNPEWRKANGKKYYEENRGMYVAKAIKRQNNMHRATPAWADDKQIEALYCEARALTISTGVDYVVDHIIPLRGRHVSGLHCQTNLRVITRIENARKSNYFSPDSLVEDGHRHVSPSPGLRPVLTQEGNPNV